MKKQNEKARKIGLGRAADKMRDANLRIRALREQAEKHIADSKAKLRDIEAQTAVAVKEANEAQRELTELASGIRWDPTEARFIEC